MRKELASIAVFFLKRESFSSDLTFSSLRPRLQTRYPARHISAILHILRAEHPAQMRLLVKHHEQIHPNYSHNGKQDRTTAHRPKITHSPTHPTKKPKYIGFRT